MAAVLTLVGALWTRLIDFWRPFDTPLVDHTFVCPMQDRFEQVPVGASDEAGGVIRLSPARSKTLVGRILPISQPIAEALARRRARRDPDSPLVFHRDGIPIRRWRTAWRTACQAAGVPTRFLHDCRRTAARNLIRASVPERVAMLLTGHKTRAIFDRYNIINEQELLEAGDQLVAYLAQHAQATPRGGRPHPARTAAPPRAPRRPFASCDAPPRKRARGTAGETGLDTRKCSG